MAESINTAKTLPDLIAPMSLETRLFLDLQILSALTAKSKLDKGGDENEIS